MGWEVANLRVGEQVLAVILGISREPWFVLLLINVLFLILGCFLDPLAIIIIFVPVFLPLVKAVGIDLVHFGLVVVLNVTIGLVTPPVGYLLYICASIAGTPVEPVVREVMPFLLALLLTLCTYWPAMVLAVPRLLLGGG